MIFFKILVTIWESNALATLVCISVTWVRSLTSFTVGSVTSCHTVLWRSWWGCQILSGEYWEVKILNLETLMSWRKEDGSEESSAWSVVPTHFAKFLVGCRWKDTDSEIFCFKRSVRYGATNTSTLVVRGAIVNRTEMRRLPRLFHNRKY